MASRVYIQKAMFISIGLFLLQAGRRVPPGRLSPDQPSILEFANESCTSAHVLCKMATGHATFDGEARCYIGRT